ncbi:hypothetical protein Tco_0555949 [Tanacetum coccineum]
MLSESWMPTKPFMRNSSSIRKKNLFFHPFKPEKDSFKIFPPDPGPTLLSKGQPSQPYRPKPLCDLQPDSHEHLFFDCSFSKQVWSCLKVGAGLQQVSPSMDAILNAIIPFARRRSSRSVIAKLVVAATAYFIWQERNYRLFKKMKRSKEQLVDCISSSIRLKLLSCRFKSSRDGLALLRHWKISDSVIS